MHIEVQVALNFVISYLYNKLPRRRVNLFGEELEKALKDKFQGHWYPEKPFKGSAFRCLKTGDPIDQVLEKAARESGVPISDILENLPAELSVWVDPGEVSYRIGEKGAVKILFSEHHDHPEESSSADREVTKTFNPEAQCFRPIDAVSNSMNGLSLSPKTSPQQGTSPTTSSTSPTFKSTTGHINTSPNIAAGTFLPRTQAPVTFTTATFAQTKFGSTKLKTSSKRANSSYRMSPTEFSNYIKQRAMQQQLHHSHIPNNHFGPIGSSSPSRSLSPNPLTLSGGIQNDPFYFPTNLVGMYAPQFGNNGGNIVNGVTNNTNVNGGSGIGGSNSNITVGNNINGIVQNGGTGHRNIFDSTHFHTSDTGGNNGGLYNGHIGNGGSKFSTYMEPHGFYGQPPLQIQQQQQQQQQQNGSVIIGGGSAVNNNNNNNNNNTNTNLTGNNSNNNSGVANNVGGVSGGVNGTNNIGGNVTPVSSPGSNQDSSKLIDGLNSFYSSTGPYQHLLVAN